MKMNFNTNQITIKNVKKLKKYFLVLALVSLIGILGYSLYTVLVIKEDQGVVNSYTQKSQELNISFDKKYLQEMDSKKAPSKVEEAGGKNPFLSF